RFLGRSIKLTSQSGVTVICTLRSARGNGTHAPDGRPDSGLPQTCSRQCQRSHLSVQLSLIGPLPAGTIPIVHKQIPIFFAQKSVDLPDTGLVISDSARRSG